MRVAEVLRPAYLVSSSEGNKVVMPAKVVIFVKIEEKFMSSYIGIDLGTTYSAVATIDKAGRPVIIENEDTVSSPKGNITASAISFKKDEAIVGDQARKIIGLNDNVVARFKRNMGTSEVYSIQGNDYTPTELSAILLKKLKKSLKIMLANCLRL